MKMCLSSAEEDKKVDPKLKQAAMTHNKMGGVVVQNLGLEGKNMIFSPFSLGTALGMLLIGAKVIPGYQKVWSKSMHCVHEQ